MSTFFTLQCPTCGAGLQIAGQNNTFSCQHCNNRYLLDRKIEEMNATEREHIQPLNTYTSQIAQWLNVAGVEVFVHAISQETIEKEHILYVEVEYRNAVSVPLYCRHDQWIVFDRDGYTYEAVKDFSRPTLYEGKRYLGMSRTITQGMKLRGWLAFVLLETAKVAYLQFSAGSPVKTAEFEVK